MAEHPDYLRKRLNAQQMAGWEAFSRVEKFGTGWAELLVSFVCRVIEENTPGRKGGLSELTRFMPSYKERPMTAEEIKAAIQDARHGTGG